MRARVMPLGLLPRLLQHGSPSPPESTLAQSAPPALGGNVTSEREGPMEGVLVSAKKKARPSR